MNLEKENTDIKTNAKQLVERCHGLASLPTIYHQLDEAIKSVNVSNFKISQIINSDPALASKLLQITNSARYNFPTNIETISHAIAIIGTAELSELALATSVISLTSKLPKSNIDYPLFWHHCIRCAINSRVIASFRREKNIEQHYVAGLLHDIGRLVLMLEAPEQYAAIIKESKTKKINLQEIERKHLGFDHSEVGYELAKQWGLPEYLQSVIRYHHIPGKEQKHQDMTMVVHFSDIIANQSQAKNHPGSSDYEMNETNFEEMGFTGKVIESIIQAMESQLEETLKIFSFQ